MTQVERCGRGSDREGEGVRKKIMYVCVSDGWWGRGGVCACGGVDGVSVSVLVCGKEGMRG